MRDHIHRLVAEGYNVSLCLNMEGLAAPLELPPEVRIVSIPIQREISPLSDLTILLQLTRFFLSERFNIVHSLSPKSGLIGMMAAWLARIPHRVHTFTGQVWVNQPRVTHWLLKSLDCLLAACCSNVLADSASQRDFLIQEGVVAENKISVLAHGSMCGVDVGRFNRNLVLRSAIRAQLGISDEEVLLLFVGRMKRDKGVIDLTKAFLRLRQSGHAVSLLLVGHDEEGFAPSWQDMPGVHHIPYTPQVEEYFSAADIFCLPSYREGFGSVLIEAGACELPVVASRIYGITDAVKEGESALLHKPGSLSELTDALERLLSDSMLRNKLGQAGLNRAKTLFRKEMVLDAFISYYRGLNSDCSVFR